MSDSPLPTEIPSRNESDVAEVSSPPPNPQHTLRPSYHLDADAIALHSRPPDAVLRTPSASRRASMASDGPHSNASASPPFSPSHIANGEYECRVCGVAIHIPESRQERRGVWQQHCCTALHQRRLLEEATRTSPHPRSGSMQSSTTTIVHTNAPRTPEQPSATQGTTPTAQLLPLAPKGVASGPDMNLLPGVPPRVASLPLGSEADDTRPRRTALLPPPVPSPSKPADTTEASDTAAAAHEEAKGTGPTPAPASASELPPAIITQPPPGEASTTAVLPARRENALQRQLHDYLFVKETTLMRECLHKWYTAMFVERTAPLSEDDDDEKVGAKPSSHAQSDDATVPASPPLHRYPSSGFPGSSPPPVPVPHRRLNLRGTSSGSGSGSGGGSSSSPDRGDASGGGGSGHRGPLGDRSASSSVPVVPPSPISPSPTSHPSVLDEDESVPAHRSRPDGSTPSPIRQPHMGEAGEDARRTEEQPVTVAGAASVLQSTPLKPPQRGRSRTQKPAPHSASTTSSEALPDTLMIRTRSQGYVGVPLDPTDPNTPVRDVEVSRVEVEWRVVLKPADLSEEEDASKGASAKARPPQRVMPRKSERGTNAASHSKPSSSHQREKPAGQDEASPDDVDATEERKEPTRGDRGQRRRVPRSKVSASKARPHTSPATRSQSSASATTLSASSSDETDSRDAASEAYPREQSSSYTAGDEPSGNPCDGSFDQEHDSADYDADGGIATNDCEEREETSPESGATASSPRDACPEAEAGPARPRRRKRKRRRHGRAPHTAPAASADPTSPIAPKATAGPGSSVAQPLTSASSSPASVSPELGVARHPAAAPALVTNPSSRIASPSSAAEAKPSSPALSPKPRDAAQQDTPSSAPLETSSATPDPSTTPQSDALESQHPQQSSKSKSKRRRPRVRSKRRHGPFTDTLAEDAVTVPELSPANVAPDTEPAEHQTGASQPPLGYASSSEPAASGDHVSENEPTPVHPTLFVHADRPLQSALPAAPRDTQACVSPAPSEADTNAQKHGRASARATPSDLQDGQPNDPTHDHANDDEEQKAEENPHQGGHHHHHSPGRRSGPEPNPHDEHRTSEPETVRARDAPHDDPHPSSRDAVLSPASSNPAHHARDHSFAEEDDDEDDEDRDELERDEAVLSSARTSPSPKRTNRSDSYHAPYGLGRGGADEDAALIDSSEADEDGDAQREPFADTDDEQRPPPPRVPTAAGLATHAPITSPLQRRSASSATWKSPLLLREGDISFEELLPNSPRGAAKALTTSSRLPEDTIGDAVVEEDPVDESGDHAQNAVAPHRVPAPIPNAQSAAAPKAGTDHRDTSDADSVADTDTDEPLGRGGRRRPQRPSAVNVSEPAVRDVPMPSSHGPLVEEEEEEEACEVSSSPSSLSSSRASSDAVAVTQPVMQGNRLAATPAPSPSSVGDDDVENMARLLNMLSPAARGRVQRALAATDEQPATVTTTAASPPSSPQRRASPLPTRLSGVLSTPPRHAARDPMQERAHTPTRTWPTDSPERTPGTSSPGRLLAGSSEAGLPPLPHHNSLSSHSELFPLSSSTLGKMQQEAADELARSPSRSSIPFWQQASSSDSSVAVTSAPASASASAVVAAESSWPVVEDETADDTVGGAETAENDDVAEVSAKASTETPSHCPPRPHWYRPLLDALDVLRDVPTCPHPHPYGREPQHTSTPGEGTGDPSIKGHVTPLSAAASPSKLIGSADSAAPRTRTYLAAYPRASPSDNVPSRPDAHGDDVNPDNRMRMRRMDSSSDSHESSGHAGRAPRMLPIPAHPYNVELSPATSALSPLNGGEADQESWTAHTPLHCVEALERHVGALEAEEAEQESGEAEDWTRATERRDEALYGDTATATSATDTPAPDGPASAGGACGQDAVANAEDEDDDDSPLSPEGTPKAGAPTPTPAAPHDDSLAPSAPLAAATAQVTLASPSLPSPTTRIQPSPQSAFSPASEVFRASTRWVPPEPFEEPSSGNSVSSDQDELGNSQGGQDDDGECDKLWGSSTPPRQRRDGDGEDGGTTGDHRDDFDAVPSDVSSQESPLAYSEIHPPVHPTPPRSPRADRFEAKACDVPLLTSPDSLGASHRPLPGHRRHSPRPGTPLRSCTPQECAQLERDLLGGSMPRTPSLPPLPQPASSQDVANLSSRDRSVPQSARQSPHTAGESDAADAAALMAGGSQSSHAASMVTTPSFGAPPLAPAMPPTSPRDGWMPTDEPCEPQTGPTLDHHMDHAPQRNRCEDSKDTPADPGLAPPQRSSPPRDTRGGGVRGAGGVAAAQEGEPSEVRPDVASERARLTPTGTRDEKEEDVPVLLVSSPPPPSDTAKSTPPFASAQSGEKVASPSPDCGPAPELRPPYATAAVTTSQAPTRPKLAAREGALAESTGSLPRPDLQGVSALDPPSPSPTAVPPQTATSVPACDALRDSLSGPVCPARQAPVPRDGRSPLCSGLTTTSTATSSPALAPSDAMRGGGGDDERDEASGAPARVPAGPRQHNPRSPFNPPAGDDKDGEAGRQGWRGATDPRVGLPPRRKDDSDSTSTNTTTTSTVSDEAVSSRSAGEALPPRKSSLPPRGVLPRLGAQPAAAQHTPRSTSVSSAAAPSLMPSLTTARHDRPPAPPLVAFSPPGAFSAAPQPGVVRLSVMGPDGMPILVGEVADPRLLGDVVRADPAAAEPNAALVPCESVRSLPHRHVDPARQDSPDVDISSALLVPSSGASATSETVAACPPQYVIPRSLAAAHHDDSPRSHRSRSRPTSSAACTSANDEPSLEASRHSSSDAALRPSQQHAERERERAGVRDLEDFRKPYPAATSSSGSSFADSLPPRSGQEGPPCGEALRPRREGPEERQRERESGDSPRRRDPTRGGGVAPQQPQQRPLQPNGLPPDTTDNDVPLRLLPQGRSPGLPQQPAPAITSGKDGRGPAAAPHQSEPLADPRAASYSSLPQPVSPSAAEAPSGAAPFSAVARAEPGTYYVAAADGKIYPLYDMDAHPRRSRRGSVTNPRRVGVPAMHGADAVQGRTASRHSTSSRPRSASRHLAPYGGESGTAERLWEDRPWDRPPAPWRTSPARVPPTTPKDPLGCGRFNPYCGTCRAKYNQVYVDENHTPVRFPSSKSPELQRLGDCRYNRGLVFGGPDRRELSPPPPLLGASASSWRPSLGEEPYDEPSGRFVPVCFHRRLSPVVSPRDVPAHEPRPTVHAQGRPAMERPPSPYAAPPTPLSYPRHSAMEAASHTRPEQDPVAPLPPPPPPPRSTDRTRLPNTTAGAPRQAPKAGDDATTRGPSETSVVGSTPDSLQSLRREERRVRKCMKQLLWHDLPDMRDSEQWSLYMESLTYGLDKMSALRQKRKLGDA